MFVSHPLAGDPSQSANPALQLRTWHTPFSSAPLPFATAHAVPFAAAGRPLVQLIPGPTTRPQDPQLFGSVLTFVSQPSCGIRLQSMNPALQLWIWHTPFCHTPLPLGTEQDAPLVCAKPHSGAISSTNSAAAEQQRLRAHLINTVRHGGIPNRWRVWLAHV
jgi:hypothetical protein